MYIPQIIIVHRILSFKFLLPPWILKDGSCKTSNFGVSDIDFSTDDLTRVPVMLTNHTGKHASLHEGLF